MSNISSAPRTPLCGRAGQGLYENIIKLKPFWQLSLLHSMFFTSNSKAFVKSTSSTSSFYFNSLLRQGQGLTRGARRRRPAWLRTRAEEQCFNLKLAGNEIYCTHVLLLLIKILLCSKPHDQKVFELKCCPTRAGRGRGSPGGRGTVGMLFLKTARKSLQKCFWT